MGDTISNEKVASKVVGHKWAFNTPESKMKYGNKAKEIDYNFAPALDSDVVSTITHQKLLKLPLVHGNLLKEATRFNKDQTQSALHKVAQQTNMLLLKKVKSSNTQLVKNLILTSDIPLITKLLLLIKLAMSGTQQLYECLLQVDIYYLRTFHLTYHNKKK